MWGVVALVVCGMGALLLSLSLALTNMSFRFLCCWYAVNGGVFLAVELTLTPL